MNTVSGVQAIRKLRGGTESQLLLGSDGRLWVVKFKNNPQGIRILVNECFVNNMGRALGFSMPDTSIVEVGSWLISKSSELSVTAFGGRREPCSAGLNFGCGYAGGLMPHRVSDVLPPQFLSSVRNLSEFAGIVALDKWFGNTDRRQAVFWRDSRSKHYTAMFIDHGQCFNGSDWVFQDAATQGLYNEKSVYSAVSGWASFEPWLSEIESADESLVRSIASAIPSEWISHNRTDFDRLVDTILLRKSRVRGLISDLRDSYAAPFPKWSATATSFPQTRSSMCSYPIVR